MERKFDLKDVLVHIGMPAYGDIPPQTTLSLVETALALTREGIGFNLDIKYGCCYVDQARCLIADEFLKTPATHLLMIDSDMGWHGWDALRLIAHATVMPCVAAAYRLKNERESYPINLLPGAVVNDYGCLPIKSMGLGFCCVQRSVIEHLAARAPKVRIDLPPRPIAAIFQCDVSDGHFRGEDIKFFADVADLGYTSYLDLEITLDHYGRKNYRGSLPEMLEKREQHFAQVQTSRELTEAIGNSRVKV